ncbi:MAG: prepilin-type N-terminal cleavage/methylation domain-containing protein [Ruminococcaceae bacterium]|jgi:prepilin-type N-terminal cleavage/methylation domain-containing protein|nr:prepilin-type N-terminal cleavage/methylation domain-containing protein [Oscillospiraceae bacterium]
MFKTISKLKSNKRGFTIPEVLVTLTIMLVALTLTTQLIILIIRGYRMVEYRWIAQTMAEYLASSLSADSGLETLGTANTCEMMYEAPTPNDAGTFSLACCPELGNLTYNTTDHTLRIVPDEDYAATLKRGYIYYFTYDEHIYRIHYTDLVNLDDLSIQTATIKPISENLNLITTSEMDAEVNIEFALARSAGDFDTTAKEEDFDTADKYLATSLTANIAVKVVNKGDRDLGSNADMNVSLYLNNMTSGEKINYISGGSALTNQYVTGWTKNSSGNMLEKGKPNATVVSNAGTTMENISHYANIVRYHSVNTPSSLADSTNDGSINVGIDMPICFFTNLTIGSDRQVQILEPLRDFRDTVLRGTAVGEWVIDKYYDWSPAFIELTKKAPVLKGAFKFVAEGLAAAATIAVE